MQQTTRLTVKAIDDIIGKTIPVLDKGFIRVIDYMGGDSAIVQAARVSYGEGTKTVRQDEALINYLIKHKHTSPLEMCEIKFHIKLPIFIARQWIRHRTANVNEVSARYSILPKDFYIPDLQNIAKQSANNKQGRGDTLTPEQAKQVVKILQNDAENCYANYTKMLDGSLFNSNTSNQTNQVNNEGEMEFEDGIARELARINLTLNFYTEWYWKTDLHNLFHFLNLRMHPHAQYEIREYANAMFDVVNKWCPLAAKAFKNHIIGSVNISTTLMQLLKQITYHGTQSKWFSDFTSNIEENLKNMNISKREYNELLETLIK